MYFEFIYEWLFELGDMFYLLLGVLYDGVVFGGVCMMFFVGMCVFL